MAHALGVIKRKAAATDQGPGGNKGAACRRAPPASALRLMLCVSSAVRSVCSVDHHVLTKAVLCVPLVRSGFVLYTFLSTGRTYLLIEAAGLWLTNFTTVVSLCFDEELH